MLDVGCEMLDVGYPASGIGAKRHIVENLILIRQQDRTAFNNFE